MIYCFLNSNRSDQVTKTNIESFYGLALTMRPGTLGWVKRAQCPGRAFSLGICMISPFFLRRHKAKSVFIDLGKREDQRAFRAAVEEHTGLTLADYMREDRSTSWASMSGNTLSITAANGSERAIVTRLQYRSLMSRQPHERLKIGAYLEPRKK